LFSYWISSVMSRFSHFPLKCMLKNFLLCICTKWGIKRIFI
jgi:hypothetical protein